MYKEQVVTFGDLRYVSVKCPNCKTVVTLDMEEPPEFGVQHDFFCPKSCPGCRQMYDTAIPRSVDTLQRSYKALSEIADRVTFRAKAVDEG